MKMRQNIDELLSVLEEVRVKKYPDVPKELVEKIALIQYENQDNGSKARIDTLTLINEYIK